MYQFMRRIQIVVVSNVEIVVAHAQMLIGHRIVHKVNPIPVERSAWSIEFVGKTMMFHFIQGVLGTEDRVAVAKVIGLKQQ
jgi:hypothetical protein